MTIWRLYYARHGGHVHCQLYCGPVKGALGKVGDLTFRHEEFREFTRLHKVLAMEFVRERNPDGSLAGEDVVWFDTAEGGPILR